MTRNVLERKSIQGDWKQTHESRGLHSKRWTTILPLNSVEGMIAYWFNLLTLLDLLVRSKLHFCLQYILFIFKTNKDVKCTWYYYPHSCLGCD